MNLWLVLGVSVFGGFGALVRYVQDVLVKAWTGARFPWGIFGINVLGSFLLGLITGLAVFGGDDAFWRIALGVGFCGGYTTFSTAMTDTVVLVRDGDWRSASANLVGTLVLAVLAAMLGLWLATVVGG